MKNKNFLYLVLYGLAICALTVVFNLIFNMYQVTTLHRVICIITISFSTALYIPFYRLFLLNYISLKRGFKNGRKKFRF